MLIPMKKATLHALQMERKEILLALQKTGEFMLLAGDDDAGLPERSEKEQNVQRIGAAIKFFSAYEKNKKIFEPRVVMSFDEFRSININADELTRKAEELLELINQIKNETITLNSQAAQLEPWKALDECINALTDTVTTRVFIGFIPLEKADYVHNELKKFIAAVSFYGECEDGQAIMVVSHEKDAEEVHLFLKENNFSETRLPKGDVTPKVLAERFLAEASKKELEADVLKKQATQLAQKKDVLKQFYDRQFTDYQRLAVRGEETVETFCVTGWVRYDKQLDIQNAVESVTDAYELSFRDPVDGEEIPSVTVNKKIIEPYEAITNLYSRPLATGIDPNPTMAPFYFLFFGMMLSDAGYGVILAILMIFVNKLFKGEGMAGKLTQVILMGAISTIIWGTLFGGWFGVEYKPLLFVPMQEPIKMLLLCYVLGAAHMLLGIFVKMYMEIKRGRLFDAVVDQMSWVVMLVGIVIYVLFPELLAGKYMALVGMITILLFAGREDKNILKRLLGGVASLYNITGYLSDVLSYSRLFALGLATGVIGMVINTIAEMLWQAGIIGQVAAILVLLGGHTFNIAVNVLGAYVHTSRLQFIEFFSKFYEPGGIEFKPLAFKTKYIDILK